MSLREKQGLLFVLMYLETWGMKVTIYEDVLYFCVFLLGAWWFLNDEKSL